ncbi:putative bifunctional diguanylate cyclase/phosphodiesterase [Pseudoroseicyclus sp. H15]
MTIRAGKLRIDGLKGQFGPARKRRVALACFAVGIGLSLLFAAVADGAGIDQPMNAAIIGVVVFLVPAAIGLHLLDSASRASSRIDRVTGLPGREDLLHFLAEEASRGARGAATIFIEIDGFKTIEEGHTRASVEDILRRTAARLRETLGDRDMLVRLDGPAFGVAPAPELGYTLEGAMTLAGRLQHALGRGMQVGEMNVYLTACVGIALGSRTLCPGAEGMLQAANTALIEAQRSGSGAIRSYSESMRNRIASRNGLAWEVSSALDKGEIVPFFQPQISSETRAISGMETLARWYHPVRGLIPPAEFLPALEQSGMMDRLGEHMLRQALITLSDWDKAGFDVPQIAVNFSGAELGDPQLVDKIGFELDRRGVSPRRLVIEVLETVVAGTAEDNVLRNLSGLTRLGCWVDLDDFGTGHASITTIRRFSIQRIKIDRSFITRINEDVDQQNMVGAILTIAEKLNLDTLAEGVETPEEIEMLARLGCAHLQGFGIGRPMPRAEVEEWMRQRMSVGSAPIPLPSRAV